METNRYLRPAWTYNGSIRTDLPLTVFPSGRKRQIAPKMQTGQLRCVGKIYLKTRDNLIRIR
jgi:hypothetical protein